MKHQESRMKDFAINIDDFSIGQTIKDFDNSDCEITNKTSNSIEVAIKKKTKNGINHTQWFTMSEFNKRFK
jgi:hypothetical protein